MKKEAAFQKAAYRYRRTYFLEVYHEQKAIFPQRLTVVIRKGNVLQLNILIFRLLFIFKLLLQNHALARHAKAPY